MHIGEKAAKLDHMPTLPRSNSSLLVRTDFTSDEVWHQVSDEAGRENSDGFRAYIEPISAPEFDGATWEVVREAVPANDHGASVLFIADSTTFTSPDHPILIVDILYSDENPPFRCIPAELWSVDNNLNIANMDWDDFTSTVDANGVFRGFG